jgi:biotin transporter BioY
MAVTVFLPGTGVAFVVVAVFHRPVFAHGACGAGLFFCTEAG